MFSDPQTVTVDSVDIDLNVVSREGQKTVYRSSDGEYAMTISHTEGTRNRRVVRLDRQIITSDPFIPANNVRVSSSAYIVFDDPIAGFTVDDIAKDVAGLVGWLTTANVTDVLQGES